MDFDVVALVGGHEVDHVARLGFYESRLEDHRPCLTLVQHLDLILGGKASAGQGKEQNGGGKEGQAFHR